MNIAKIEKALQLLDSVSTYKISLTQPAEAKIVRTARFVLEEAMSDPRGIPEPISDRDPLVNKNPVIPDPLGNENPNVLTREIPADMMDQDIVTVSPGDEILHLQSSLDEAASALDEATRKNIALSDHLEIVHKQVSVLQQKVNSLEFQLDVSNKADDTWKGNYGRSQEQVRRLKTEYETLQKRLGGIIDSKNKIIDDQTRSIEDLRGTNFSYQNDRDTAQKNCMENAQALMELRAEYDALTFGCDELKKEYSALGNETRKLRTRSEGLEIQVKQYEVDLANALAHNVSPGSNENNLRRIIAAKEERITELRQGIAAATKALNSVDQI